VRALYESRRRRLRLRARTYAGSVFNTERVSRHPRHNGHERLVRGARVEHHPLIPDVLALASAGNAALKLRHLVRGMNEAGGTANLSGRNGFVIDAEGFIH